MNEVIKKKPDLTTKKYKAVYLLKSVTGIAYITTNSPQFISGHLRLRGKNNGSYPYKYRELITELFGNIQDSQEEIEVCSGTVAKSGLLSFCDNYKLVTVDINPAKKPTHIMNGENLPTEWANRFARWSSDPPYTDKAAKTMYQTDKMPSISKLLTEGARVTKPGGLLFLLLGAKNMQWCPKSLVRIGWFGITIVPNQEIRGLHCYLKTNQQ